jgi:hypothetical protein
MRPFGSLAGLVLVTAGSLAACKADRPTALKQSSDTVSVTATDYAFDAPAELTAGVTTLRLDNQGKELHHAQLVRIEEGKTADDMLKALRTPGPLPGWIKFVGGPNAVVPGRQAVATSGLAPGHYAYVCFIPTADGVMHVEKGMIRPFEVTGSTDRSVTELPAADVTITLVDYDFQSSVPLTPGKHTIMVENAGPQLHELALLKLAPGKKVEDFARWAETGMKGPPPAEPVGGVVNLEKGGRASFSAELTPGDYGLMCFVPDAKDGKPHLAHGMMKTIRVS